MHPAIVGIASCDRPDGYEIAAAYVDRIQPNPMASKKQYGFVNRELSWLSFNARVLQEARDPRVPLYERLKFLAIYSSNLDEFFRVRVASLRSLLRLKKKTVEKLGIHPAELLRQIHETVSEQQELFGATFREDILPQLEERGIHLINESALNEDQLEFLMGYFEEHVRPHLSPSVLGLNDTPFLENRQVYLAVELFPKSSGVDLSAQAPHVGIVVVPSPPIDRFVSLPSQDSERYVMFLDDVIRGNLPSIFPDHTTGAAFAVKLSRDAELYLDDEFEGGLVEKIRKSLDKRERGLPCRFLYDLHASSQVIDVLKSTFELEEEDVLMGGRYHNLHDLVEFPRFDMEGVTYERIPPLPHPDLEDVPNLFDAVAERDRLVHYPYQRFDYVVRFLREAVEDPAVESIAITLYRTAANSAIVRALLDGARAGKEVTAFVEVKARFDEANNLEWADQMEAAGVRTLYSFEDLKVHAKLALVTRREGEELRRYAYLGTGNFNEVTARFYADHGLFTADPRITNDVARVFEFLSGEVYEPTFDHVFVAPFFLRKGLLELIESEIRAAEEGRPARIIAKLNALEDEKMIRKLYDASKAGVDVDLIVRGICCLVPGVPGQSERIRIRSIVDRFLEHARIFIFENGGDVRYFLGSADWMTRNLSRRLEVVFPILDPQLQAELRDVVELQLADNVKARLIDAEQKNEYASLAGKREVRAQMELYQRLQEKCSQSVAA